MTPEPLKGKIKEPNGYAHFSPQDIKSAVEFYKTYRNDRSAFKKAFPDIHSGFKEFKEKNPDLRISYFRYWREWLFDYAFSDVVVKQ